VLDADRLIHLAASNPVIVNLPAQSHLSVLEWMEKNYLLSLDDDLPLEIYKWFICTPTQDSISLFTSSLAAYRGSSYVKHVLVKNLAFGKDWSFLGEDPEFVASGGLDVPTLEIGELAQAESHALNSKILTFNVAAGTVSSSPPALRMMSQKRVYDYFKSARDALDALSLIRFYSEEPPPARPTPPIEEPLFIAIDF
jgi:hypothetical protein